VLGATPVAGAPSAYELTAFNGLMTPAGLLAAANGPLAGSHASRGGNSVIEQVAHAVDSVLAKLPDWSRPIITALLVLLLLFGAHSSRTRRRAKKATLQNKVMQDALVPVLPERVAGSRLSGSYRPADGVAQGGDFYDVFALDDHRAAILLGDVSGHDLSALGRSNAVRHKLRTLIEEGFEEGRELRRVLDKASRALSKQWDEGDFVTAAVAIHDAEAGTLTYACAGHPAPALAGAAAHDPVSVCSSPALGWGLPTGRRQTTVSFGAGDTACFFTDGLIEARVNGGLLGREGLERLVGDLGETGSANTLLRAVIGLAHEADDDLAVLVTRSETTVPAPRLRIEVLEFGAYDVRRRAPERFLAACDAPPELIERLGARARSLTAGGPRGVLRVEFDGETGAVEAAIEPMPAAVEAEPIPA
jgi:Stage II sporulation protein E (SpoIIE)